MGTGQADVLVRVATEHFSTRRHFRKGLKVMKGEPQGRPREGVPGGGTARRRPEHPWGLREGVGPLRPGRSERGALGPAGHTAPSPHGCHRHGAEPFLPSQGNRNLPPHCTPRPVHGTARARRRWLVCHALTSRVGRGDRPTEPIIAACWETRWGELAGRRDKVDNVKEETKDKRSVSDVLVMPRAWR